MSVAIRQATGHDVAALHALIESAYRGDSARRGWTHEADLLDGQRTDVESLRDMLDDPSQTILIAEDAAGSAGCVALQRRGAMGYVGLMTVDPERQAQGLGRQLLQAAEAQARADGLASAEMTVIAQRAELVAWYERRGYRRTGEQRPFPLDDSRFGLPKTRDLVFVVMEKRL